MLQPKHVLICARQRMRGTSFLGYISTKKLTAKPRMPRPLNTSSSIPIPTDAYALQIDLPPQRGCHHHCG